MKPNIATNTQYHYQYFAKALTIPNTNILKGLNNTQYQYLERPLPIPIFQKPLTIPIQIPIVLKHPNVTQYQIPIPHPIILLTSDPEISNAAVLSKVRPHYTGA